MKRQWQRIALKIDALHLRERAMIFAAVTVILITLMNSALLEPQTARQRQLSQRISQERTQIAGIQAEIQEKARSQAIDPDAATRARLQALRQQSAKLQSAIRDVQKGLVSPNKMNELLESILKQNGKLRLISMKTLPVTASSESIPTQGKAAGEKTPAAAIVSPTKDKQESGPATANVYKHGVEVVVQGGYLDMMNYMAALEAMPWQLFWRKMKLSVDEFPKANLTLTLFTMSLDKAWLNI